MTGRDMQRRRGAALEDALLDAAWAELNEHSYAGFTLEGVARRGGTSRPVLSRRWPTRAELAMAALGRYIATHPVTVPDLGSVREELILFLRRTSDRVVPSPLAFVLELRSELPPGHKSLNDIRQKMLGRSTDVGSMNEILRRGVERGEIDPARLSPRVVAVPTDLARAELIMSSQPLSDEAIQSILDDVFLPLVRLEK